MKIMGGNFLGPPLGILLPLTKIGFPPIICFHNRILLNMFHTYFTDLYGHLYKYHVKNLVGGLGVVIMHQSPKF